MGNVITEGIFGEAVLEVAVWLLEVAMWRSCLMRQSGNPEVVGLSPAGEEQLAVGRTFSGQSYKRFVPLATLFTPPR